MSRKPSIGKWVRTKNENVRSFWICPECKETYETTFADIEEVGWPKCPDCDLDCEFSHILVKESKRKGQKPIFLKVRYGTDGITPKEDREICTYRFSTKEDRDQALKMLCEHDGYLESEVANEDGTFDSDGNGE